MVEREVSNFFGIFRLVIIITSCSTNTVRQPSSHIPLSQNHDEHMQPYKREAASMAEWLEPTHTPHPPQSPRPLQVWKAPRQHCLKAPTKVL